MPTSCEQLTVYTSRYIRKYLCTLLQLLYTGDNREMTTVIIISNILVTILIIIPIDFYIDNIISMGI